MANTVEKTITSSELGTLWMTYQINSAVSIMFRFLAQKNTDRMGKDILNNFVNETEKLLNDIRLIFNNENAVVPVAFNSTDIFNDAPSLYDDTFHIMFLRFMTKIKLGFNPVHLSMSFRKDIRGLYQNALKISQDTYNVCTDYLTEQGVLIRSPYVTMPKKIEFIEDIKYMSGLQLLGNKRALNTLEVAYLFQTLEANVTSMQLLTGFAQVAKESEVKDYFVKGKDLAKRVISDISNIFLESDIQPPTTWAGKATDSIVSPFSDKLMMFLANMVASYALANNSLGMAFSMRSDLPIKLALITKDTMEIAREGGKLMIDHKWLEEPPQMDDRSQLINSK